MIDLVRGRENMQWFKVTTDADNAFRMEFDEDETVTG